MPLGQKLLTVFSLFSLILFCVSTVHAAGGSYDWAYGWTRSGGSAGEEFGGQSVAIDTTGNIFVTGGFSYTVNFDDTGGTDEHVANGDYADIFITKYNSDGSYGWTRTFGGPAEDYGAGIATDSDGNVFVTGYYQGTADFDATGGTDNHTANGGADIFITKYNSDGSYGWTRTIGATSDQLGYAITVDLNDDVIAMGLFYGTVNFDVTGGTDNHSSASGTTFITKYHNDGSYSWTRTFGKSGQWWDYDVTTDADGYIYATGFFTGTADFDGSDGVDIHTSNGGNDIFITRLSTDGNYKWTKTIGGSGDDGGSGITTDANGHVLVTGYFSDTVNFNTNGGTDNHTASGGKDLFIFELKENGTSLWTKTLGGNTIYDWGNDIATDVSGNIFVNGVFGGVVDFDVSGGIDSYTAGPGGDSFITKYNADGSYGWTRPMGGTSVDDYAEAFAVAVKDKNVYVTGFFIGTIDFDGSVGIDNHSSDPGNFDFFLVNYADDAPNVSNILADIASASGQITWTTDATTSSQIQYGLTEDYGSVTDETDTSAKVTDHSATIPGLQTCAHYYYRVLSTDNDGNKAISTNRSFNASGCLASSVVSGTDTLLATTGGSLDLVNGQSTITLLVQDGSIAEDAVFQINILDSTSVPDAPSGTRLVKGNFYNLLAVADGNNRIDTFDQPVVFTVQYGPDTATSFQEGTLDVYKYDGSGWIKQNCTLNTTNNTITCTLGGFSVYGVFGQEQPGSFAGSSAGSAPVCGDTTPFGWPDLFQINVLATKATLYFTPVLPDRRYFISFSTKPSAEEHGAEVQLGNIGIQNFTVNYLTPNTSYYFKVRGQNGCMPGSWSSIMKITTQSKNNKSFASFYKYGKVKRKLFYSQ